MGIYLSIYLSIYLFIYAYLYYCVIVVNVMPTFY